MIRRALWTLLLAFFLGAAALAGAQDGADNGTGTSDEGGLTGDGLDDESALAGDGAPATDGGDAMNATDAETDTGTDAGAGFGTGTGDEGFESDTSGSFGDEAQSGFGSDTFSEQGMNACGGSGSDGGATGSVADVDARRVTESTSSQDVRYDEDNVLLGIALANNGASDVDLESLREYDLERTQSRVMEHDASLDREDVFSALALGVDTSSGDGLSSLMCISDSRRAVTEETTASRDVNLDEDTVLLAIALSNNVDGDLSFENVASFDEESRSETTLESENDIDREDAFLSLALGGGSESS